MGSTMWMVRAGRNGRWTDAFISEGLVGLGWHGVGDSTAFRSKADLLSEMRSAYPDMSEGTAASGASQLWRFRKEISTGDEVVTYDGGTRLYHIGRVSGEARFQSGDIEELTLRRAVAWQAQVSRDKLSLDSRNRLGSTLTLFRIPEHTATELRDLVSGHAPTITETTLAASDADEEPDPFASIVDRAVERIKDRIALLDWNEMQELVAALLRALGYRTIVSPLGADRGKDIIASRDGFGFERPRIVVEVKHRRGAMGSHEIRSFLGGRHADDRGLYVSTGGFTKDAYYEAERASTVTHLMTLDDLARAIVDQYERLDERGRRLLPLTRIYWPL